MNNMNKVKSFSYRLKVYAGDNLPPKVGIKYEARGCMKLSEKTTMNVGGNELSRTQVKEMLEDVLSRYIGNISQGE